MKPLSLISVLCAMAYGQMGDEQPSTLPILFPGDDPMHPYLIAYAESMNYTMCYVGNRDITINAGEGVVQTGDSMAPAICEYPGSKCVHVNATTTSADGYTTITESGACVPPMTESTFTCESYIERISWSGNFSDCSFDVCEGNLCNVFTTKSSTICNKTIAENDINILPKYTMREILDGIEYITRDFYSGFPYQSQDQCRYNLKTTINNLAIGLADAGNSPCMSVFDWVPGFRSQLQNFRLVMYAAILADDIDDFWHSVSTYFQLGTDQDMLDNFKMYFDELSCPTPGKVPTYVEDTWKWAKENDFEKAVYEWMEGMGIDVSMILGDSMVGMATQSVCSDQYWSASMKASLDFMWQWYSAETREDTCNAVNTMQIRSINAWDHMCDDNKVYPALIAMYGEENRDSVDVIAKMLMIWDDIYTHYEFPNCAITTKNKSPLGCEQYYGSETPCGKRKAWLCDWADWQFGFLADWLVEYQAFEANSIFSPIYLEPLDCDDFDMTDICKNSEKQMCMTMPVTGCWTCYCSDHEYKDLSGISEVYRKDYMEWQRVFRTYKKAFSSATCKEEGMKTKEMGK